MAHPLPASGEEVVAEEPGGIGRIGDRDQAEAVRKNVGVVQRRDGEGHLELPRQILPAVQGILERPLLFGRKGQRHTFNPDLVISPGLREERRRYPAGVRQHPFGQRTNGGSRRRHHISTHVAAGRERCAQRVVDPFHQRSQLSLHHTVPLE